MEYKVIKGLRAELMAGIIMIVELLVPVGMLLGIAFKRITWWKTFLISCSISIAIEALQFLFMKGFSEVDDVMHNTMGGLIGFGVSSLIELSTRFRKAVKWNS